MTTLTVIPAIFKDPERALANLVAAKDRFEQANHALAASLRKGGMTGLSADLTSVVMKRAIMDSQAEHERVVVEAEQARSAFDVAFAIYQETARARDAAASHASAEASVDAIKASNEHAKAVRDFTSWIAIAAIIQGFVGLGLLFEGCAKIGPR